MSFEYEDAWCGKLEDYLFRDIPNSIQFQDIGLGIFCPISRDGGADGFSHISWLDPNRNRRIVYLNRNSDNRKLNLNYPDNRFNDNCVLAGVRRRKPLRFNPAFIFWRRAFPLCLLDASIRRAYGRFLQAVPKARCICCYPKLLFPMQAGERI